VRNDHNASGNKIPGLGDIPGLGRLFGSNKDDMSKSELVLAITPRIVRNLPYQSPSDMEFGTGTESSMQVRQMALPQPASSLPTDDADDQPAVQGQMAARANSSPRP
jgi:general secretion pathway protein D